MRATLAVFLGLLLVLVVAPADARASETVSGEGYAFSLPGGYAEPSADGCAAARALATKTFSRSCIVEGEPDMRVWVRGETDAPQSVLVLVRMDVRSDSEGVTGVSLEELQSSMEPMRRQCEQMGVLCVLQDRRVAGHKGFELIVDGLGDLPGSDLGAMRLVYVPFEQSVFAMLLMSTAGSTSGVQGEWEGLLAGLRIQDTGGPNWLLIGGVGIGILGLGFVSMRPRHGTHRTPRPMAPSLQLRPGPGDPHALPAASRAARPGPGDMPPDSAPGGNARVPSATGAAASAIALSHSTAPAAPPGLRPTWDAQRKADLAKRQAAAAKPPAPLVPTPAVSATLKSPLGPTGRWSDKANAAKSTPEARV